jgi:glycosyltransferase involved in cell wall biosynthesis
VTSTALRSSGVAAGGASVTLSAAATLGALGSGQGLYKLARSLQGAVADLRVICAADTPGLLEGVHVDTIQLQYLLWAAVHSPLRFSPALQIAAANNYFDWRASRLAGLTDLLYAYSDQALWSIRAAHRHGAAAVLHAANTHVDNLWDVLGTEARLHGARQNWISPFMVWKIRREYEEADYLRAQSTLVRDSLIAHGIPASKIVMVPPAVDLARFRPGHDRDATFRVVFVGAFDLRKGLPHLLRAWDDAKLPRSQLVLHGAAGSRFMERMVAPYRRRPDVVFCSGDPALTFAQADVCVVPSVEDGFAYTVLEALASGCPVVVTDQVGGKDAVVSGENGYVVPARDAGAIRDRLVELFAAPRQRAAMARAARRSAEAYDFAAERAALLEALPRLLAGRGPTAVRGQPSRTRDAHETA